MNLQGEEQRLAEHARSPRQRAFLRLERWVPALKWARSYDRGVLSNDLVAAVILTFMLIPQSMVRCRDQSVRALVTRRPEPLLRQRPLPEDHIYDLVASRPEVREVVLMCPAVNGIDASALKRLEAIVDRLRTAGVSFHFSEVKGPVMDRLKRSEFFSHLTGQVFLSQHLAMSVLDPETTAEADAGSNHSAITAAAIST